MRFILTLFIWTLFVGGLWLYTWQRDAGLPTGPTAMAAVKTIEGHFTLELTPTFSVEKDPFALMTDDAPHAAMDLHLNGENVEVHADTLSRGKTITLENLPPLHPGFNEIYLKASPPISESGLTHGIRIRILNEMQVVIDKTVWEESGGLVSGSLPFNFTQSKDGTHDQEK